MNTLITLLAALGFSAGTASAMADFALPAPQALLQTARELAAQAAQIHGTAISQGQEASSPTGDGTTCPLNHRIFRTATFEFAPPNAEMGGEDWVTFATSDGRTAGALQREVGASDCQSLARVDIGPLLDRFASAMPPLEATATQTAHELSERGFKETKSDSPWRRRLTRDRGTERVEVTLDVSRLTAATALVTIYWKSDCSQCGNVIDGYFTANAWFTELNALGSLTKGYTDFYSR